MGDPPPLAGCMSLCNHARIFENPSYADRSRSLSGNRLKMHTEPGLGQAQAAALIGRLDHASDGVSDRPPEGRRG